MIDKELVSRGAALFNQKVEYRTAPTVWDIIGSSARKEASAPAEAAPNTTTAPTAPSSPSPVRPVSPPALTSASAARSDGELDRFDRAAAFLTNLADGGLVAVASIVPDGPLAGRTFNTSSEHVALATWLRDNDGIANLYFSLNEPTPANERKGKAGKLTEGDVARIRGVAIDLDPANPHPGSTDEEKRELFARERKRLLELADGWPNDVFAPAGVVIDSGGGVQALYLFDKPMPATADNIAAVKVQARALNRRYGADATQSVDHLFRIPFTTNLPNAKKRAFGRDVVQAKLRHFKRDARCALSDLAMIAPPVAEAPAAAVDMEGFDYAEVIASAEGESLPARLATVLAEMRKRRSVDTALANSDRSARDFALAACCVEYGLTNPTEIGQVTFSLSPEKLLEKDGQGYGESYAAGTIKRALAATKPRVEPSADDFFTGAPAAPGEQAAAPTRLELHVVGGGVDPKSIPVRKWIVEPQVPVGDVALCIGEPGVSKSTLALRTALAVATGREDILRGRDASGGPITAERLHRSGAVLVYNAEDRLFEMQRRLRAAQVHYGVAAADMRHPIVLYSGVDMPTLKVMNRPDTRGPLKRAEGADLLEEAISRYDIKLLVADPLVALATGALENDNNDMDTVLQTFANMAAKLDIGMMLLHHTNKGGRDKAGDMGAARGASAIAGKVRVAFTLTKVTGDGENEAGWGLKAEEHLVRLDYAKRTLTKPGNETVIFKRASVSVGNGSGVLPQGVSDLFEASPLARLEAEGDAAPVLEVIDTKGRMLAAAQEASANAGAANVQIARAADAVLGDDTEAGLGDVWERLGKVLRDERVTRATGRDTLRVLVIDALAGGVEFKRDGQNVRVEAVQIKRGKTAPWVIKRALRPVAKEID